MLGPEPVEEDTSIQHTIDVITQELYVIAEGGGSATPLFTLVLGAVIGLIEVLKPLDGAATQDYGSYPALETTRIKLGDARG